MCLYLYNYNYNYIYINIYIYIYIYIYMYIFENWTKLTKVQNYSNLLLSIGQWRAQNSKAIPLCT